MPAKVIDWELSEPTRPWPLEGHTKAAVYVRLRGTPLGCVRLAGLSETLQPEQAFAALAADPKIAKQVNERMLRHWLLGGDAAAPAAPPRRPWSVVVCTRDRPEHLDRCLASLEAMERTHGEIIVVDNAPSDDRGRDVAMRYPVRYVREDRPGLNAARQRGALESRGEIVLYTDDDVVVDAGWVRAALTGFDGPRVAAVTGLTLPHELETRAQELFEFHYGGLGRGFVSRDWDYTNCNPTGANQVGAGANMAFRRSLILQLGLFEPEMDCGTTARTGGDAYAFYRLLREGYRIRYETRALAWHRHRRDEAALRRALVDYTVGGFAFLTRAFLEHNDWQAFGTASQWFLHDHIKQLVRWCRRQHNHLPLGMVVAQWGHVPAGVWAGWRTARADRRRRRLQRPEPAAMQETAV